MTKPMGQADSVSAPISLQEFESMMVTIRTSLFGEKEFNSIKNYITEESAPIPSRKAIGDLFNLSRDLIQRLAMDLRVKSAKICELTSEVITKDEQIEALRSRIS